MTDMITGVWTVGGDAGKPTISAFLETEPRGRNRSADHVADDAG